jgi:peptidoglycan-N-acetylglucosamine deacetylase
MLGNQMFWISIGLSIFSLIWLVLLPPRWLFTIVSVVFPGVVYFAAADGNNYQIALTIDDGPDRDTTDRILDMLERHGATATFFIITDRIPGNEPILTRMLASGHELGNHTTADIHSITHSAAEFERDLVAADRSLGAFTRPQWFRPAGGWYRAAIVKIAHKYNYRVALGSIFPYDTNIASPWFATQFVLANAGAGKIIVLHDAGIWGKNTAKTLDRVLPQLKRRGYQIVTLSQLFADRV